MFIDGDVELGLIDIELLGHVLNEAPEFRILCILHVELFGNGLDDVREFANLPREFANLPLVVGLSLTVVLSLGVKFTDVST